MAMTKAMLKKYPPDLSMAQTVCTQSSVKDQPIGLSTVKFLMISSGLADVKLVGEKLSDPHYIHLLATRHGIIGTIPMIGQDDETVLYRLVVSLGKLTERKSTDGEITCGICKSQPLTLEELQSLIDERSSPFKMKAVDPVWLTRFGVNERKANGFRRGRAFIMGDAAHCHSPAGGHGMHIGLQDVYNLGWKISAVLKYVARDPEQLLDSYFIEREPHVD